MNNMQSRSARTKRRRQIPRALATFLVLASLAGWSGAYPRTVSAQVAEPYLQYFRIWKNGDKIYAKYCGRANSHEVIWGESYPADWNWSKSYGAMNGCWQAYLFSGVIGNEKLWVTIYMYGQQVHGYYQIKFDATTVYYPEGIDDGTHLYCNGVKAHPTLRNDFIRPTDADAGCTFVAFPE